MKTLIIAIALLSFPPLAVAVQIAGIDLEQQVITDTGDTLQLNGVGLREKFWVDIYVGSLYLVDKTSNASDILNASTACRIQMDFVYKLVPKHKLINAWREGFEKNQDEATMAQLKSRIKQFYSYFDSDAVKGDRYVLDYVPGTGTRVIKNQTLLGIIAGADFKAALLAIWVGNVPVDNALKKSLLGR